MTEAMAAEMHHDDSEWHAQQQGNEEQQAKMVEPVRIEHNHVHQHRNVHHPFRDWPVVPVAAAEHKSLFHMHPHDTEHAASDSDDAGAHGGYAGYHHLPTDHPIPLRMNPALHDFRQHPMLVAGGLATWLAVLAAVARIR